MNQSHEALKNARADVDRIDEMLVLLLNQRAKVAERIAAVKHALGQDLRNDDREKEVRRNVATYNRGPFTTEAIIEIFNQIIEETLKH